MERLGKILHVISVKESEKLNRRFLLRNLFAISWQGGIVGTMTGNCRFYDIKGMQIFDLSTTAYLFALLGH